MPARPLGCSVRIVGTNDLLGTFSPRPTTYGATGDIALISALVDHELASGPTIWLDSGDLACDPASTEDRHWGGLFAKVPISAACAGNHEFDHPRLLPAAGSRAGFPLLCADRDAGLPAMTILDTPNGSMAVVGVSHPQTHYLAHAPARRRAWKLELAAELRRVKRQGVRWVVGLWHHGVTWAAPQDAPAVFRTRTWEADIAGVTQKMDALLGGHTLTGWRGELLTTTAAQAHPFAGSLAVVDLMADGTVRSHPLVPLDATQPVPAAASHGSSSLALDVRSLETVPQVGELSHHAYLQPGHTNTLGQAVAEAWTKALPDVHAAFVPACDLWTQPPLDGIAAGLAAGPVTHSDVERLFPFDDALVVVELRDHEWSMLRNRHDDLTSWGNTASDNLWWNWARSEAGTSQRNDGPRRIVMSRFASRLASELLNRPLATHELGVTPRTAFTAGLTQ